MKQTAATVPGFLSVKGAGEQLKLAPRSVRDLIYTGRLPSVRLGRYHYLSAGDVELERRRRLGLPLPRTRSNGSEQRRPRRPAEARHQVAEGAIQSSPGVRGRPRSGSETRRRRATERAQLLERWLRSGHGPGAPQLPFQAVEVVSPGTCDVCQRLLRPGTLAVLARLGDAASQPTRLCQTCARRSLLEWADLRRREAIAARRMAGELGTAPSASALQAA